ncbi:inositol 2-dehydrogenase [Paenibacillus sp. y28]|uniref:inositol 2-dehydrogenase n=1 Tax=Paenibacillus sp. y28 TaxID=3129110 RepID=UPI00301AE539
MKTVNIGIIGAGRIGQLHAENLARSKRANVKAISDIRVDLIEQWARALGIETVTTDSRKLLEDPEIEAIFICSSTDSHITYIEAAAKAGKHIFCEKPVSFDLKQTKRALEIVEEHGVKLQTGFNRRFDHNFMKIRHLLNEGRLGDPHIIKITSRDPNPPGYDYVRVSGGLLFDMAIHDFDMARFLSGSEVAEVYVQGAVLVDPAIGELGDIDTAVTTLKFENGAIGVIDNSRKAVYGYDQRVEVFGSGGNVSVSNDSDNSAEWSTAEGVFREKPKYFFLERYQEAYIRETEAFIDAILENKDVPVSGRDAYMAELIAAAAKQSLTEKRPVSIQEAAKGLLG